jgi:hypothetical protein
VRDELQAQPDAARPRPPARGADHRRGSPDKRRDLELVRSLVHGHTRASRAIVAKPAASRRASSTGAAPAAAAGKPIRPGALRSSS